MSLKIDMEKPGDALAFGRATIDLYANEIGPMEDAVTFSKYVGGSPANTAVAMAKLGLKVGYIGKVSDDPFGRYIVRYLDAKGVDVSHIAVADPGIRSGVTMGEIKSAGECNCFLYRQNCADLHINCAQLDEAYIARYKLLLISGTSLSHSPAREAAFLALEYAKRNGVAVAFDMDYRDGTWDDPDETSVYYMLAAEKSDLVLGTREEFDAMERLYLPGNRDDAVSAERLLKKGRSIVLIKRGKQGSTVFTADQKFRGGTYPAKVLKTFGAGDAYSAAFLYCLLNGKGIATALRYGAAAAAITIAGHSCSDSTPDLKSVENYIAKNEYTTG